MSEPNQKIENLLNMSLSVTPEERSRSPELDVGFDSANDIWEVIVRHSGDLSALSERFREVAVISLSNDYAILRVPRAQIAEVAALPAILYMEKPKRLFFAAEPAQSASCLTALPAPYSRLTGSGTIVGIIDSGIDYAHPDFCNPDGSTRILALWDQSLPSSAAPELALPDGFLDGILFTRDRINEALKQSSSQRRREIVPSTDLSGHGTHVAGIAAGNGRASGGAYRGVAYEAELLIVKLASPRQPGFPSTVELMQAIDFCVQRALALQKPLALNLSFGNSYGSHSGTSLLETYLSGVSQKGKTCIICGSGNEGDSGGHASGRLTPDGGGGSGTTAASAGASGSGGSAFGSGSTFGSDGNTSGFSSTFGSGSSARVEFAVSDYETALNLQLWKYYHDELRIRINGPRQTSPIMITPVQGLGRYRLGDTELLVYYGEPSPYSIYQEIYLELLPVSDYLDPGIWTITLTAQKVTDGSFDLWLPSAAIRNAATRFLQPEPATTLTIPSTSPYVITVGAYNSYFDSLASFSGRGYTWGTRQIKPELAAPGVDITSCAPGGGYAVKTGTSMAAPFVTGSCALLMQWGIGMGNDAFLYGEKAKAYLIRGARHLAARTDYPDPSLGWGVLCLKNSFPD